MPAVSKSQQMAAGAALRAKKEGKVDDLPAGASKEMAKSMSQKELEKLASTKHKDLPKEKKKEGRSYVGTSLAEVLEEEGINEEMLGVEEGDEITTQKSKSDRVEEKESKRKSTKDSWTSAVNSIASHSRHPLSMNTAGARVAEHINVDRWQKLAGIILEQVDENDSEMEEAMLGGISNSAPNPGHKAKMNECGDEDENEYDFEGPWHSDDDVEERDYLNVDDYNKNNLDLLFFDD